jgi:hydrogenase nickel incorporation protein HypA/HybF
MHEVGLCEGVLGVVLDVAAGAPVERVRVRVGRLQRVWPESFEQAWRLLVEGTGAERSAVELHEVPVRLRCRGCGRLGEGTDLALCPGCGSADVEVLAGDELMVEEVALAGGLVRRNPALADSGRREEE